MSRLCGGAIIFLVVSFWAFDVQAQGRSPYDDRGLSDPTPEFQRGFSEEEVDRRRRDRERRQRPSAPPQAFSAASGTSVLGPSNVSGRGELRTTVELTQRYASPPRIIATPHPGEGDMIAVAITAVTTDSFEVWAWRLNGGPWQADLHLHWIEVGEPE